MIQYFIEMPIEKQTWTVLAIGWVMLAASAAIREKTPPGECRNWARALGVFGVLVVSLQTVHTTMIAEELNTELMVRRGTHDVEQTEAVATQISDPVRVVAVASEYVATVAEGLNISVTRFSDGRTGPLSVTAGCGGVNSVADSDTRSKWRSAGESTGGSDRRTGAMPPRESGRRF